MYTLGNKDQRNSCQQRSSAKSDYAMPDFGFEPARSNSFDPGNSGSDRHRDTGHERQNNNLNPVTHFIKGAVCMA